MNKPSWSILHAKEDQYVPAIKTDIRKTFARIQREREQAEALDRAGIKSIPIKRKA